MQPDALCDPQLERTLLAALLADNRGFNGLSQLEPDDLADPVHAAVLTAMLDIKVEGRAVSLTTLRGRFGSVPFADHGSVLDYLRTCEFAGNGPDVGEVAAALRELSQRRKIVAMGERIAGSVFDQAAGPSTLLTDAAREVDELLAECLPAGRTLWGMSDAVADLLTAEDDTDRCVTTGFLDTDRMTSGGLRRGELCILAGRPSMGKSAMALAQARRAASAGHGVLLFSSEMSTRACMA